MSAAYVTLANQKNMATEARSETIDGKAVTTHRQKVVLDSGADSGEALFSYIRDGAAENMAVDGTVPVSYLYTVAADKVAFISSAIVKIVDGVAPTVTEFGGIAALANGLKVELLETDLSVLLDILDGEAIKSNGDFGLLTRHIEFFTGTGDDVTLVAIDFEGMLGRPLKLYAGQAFRVTVQDNLAALTSMLWQLRGRLEPAT